jgi:hypothetical protein
MERKAFGFLLMGLTLAAPAFSQGRHQQAPVVNRPPVAAPPASSDRARRPGIRKDDK